MIHSFNIDGNQHYSVESVAKMIQEYIYRIKGAVVKIRLKREPKGYSVFPEDVELFTRAACYAIPAWEGGFKLKSV